MSNIKKFRIKSFKKDVSVLKLEKVSLKYGKKTILDSLNLNLRSGQILGLLGPNGVGKSTIFNLITGALTPDYGSIIINSAKSGMPCNPSLVAIIPSFIIPSLDK